MTDHLLSTVYYDVWFDPELPDLIAVPSDEMTTALRDRLSLEDIEVRTTQAVGTRAAVRQAFPERFNASGQMVTTAELPVVREVARFVTPVGRTRH